jgi:hypothetical protein
MDKNAPVFILIAGIFLYAWNLPSRARRNPLHCLEKWALADAVRSYVDDRIIRFENKTIVF